MRKPGPVVTIACTQCGKLMELKRHKLESHLRQSKSGFLYCSHSCSAKMQHVIQNRERMESNQGEL